MCSPFSLLTLLAAVAALSRITSAVSADGIVVAAAASAVCIAAALVVMFTALILFRLGTAYTGTVTVHGSHGIDVAVASTASTATVVLLRREKLIDREFKGFEQLTGILVFVANAAVAGAILIRNTEIVCRKLDLNVPLQLNNRKLTERYNEDVTVGAEIERFALEAATDRRRNLTDFTAAAAGGWCADLCLKKHWVEHFYDGSRHIRLGGQLHIGAVVTEFGGENMRASLAAEKNTALIKDGQTIDDCRTADAGADFDCDTVEKANIDCEETAVELDLLHIDVDMEQLRCTRSDGHRAVVDQRLICCR